MLRASARASVRTSVRLAALALLTSLAAAGGAGLVSSPAHAADLTSISAVPADSVVDAYGVGVHLAWLDTPYKDAAAVADKLDELGVRHVRDDLYMDNPGQYAAIGTVADKGIGFDLIMGDPTSPATSAEEVQTVATKLPAGAVESLEGSNEWDLSGRPDWATELLTRQQQLYTAAKANPATAQLPVLSPALAFRWNYAALGTTLGLWSDYANAHMYPGGYSPTNEVSRITAAVRTAVGAKPLVTTEAGYHNAMSTTNGHLPVPEDVAGVYTPRVLLEHFRLGEKRVYTYELLDAFDEPGNTNPEAHFGMLRHDLSPKPAFTAMKNLLALLDDPGPAFTPQALPLRVDGWPSDGRYVLTQKRDGRYVLLMWRDVNVYDPVTKQALPVTPTNVTLNLGTTSLMTVNRPSQAAAPVSQTIGTSVPLALDGSVTAVTIGDPEVLPAPTGVTATRGNGYVDLAWTAPTDPRVQSVEVTRVGGATTTLPVGTTTFRDTGLTNGTSYTWTLRSTGPTGWSTTVTSPSATPAAAPSAPVISSAVCASKKLTVTWSAAAANGSPVTSYQAKKGTTTQTLAASARSAVFGSVTKASGVSVSVRATNAIGSSPWTTKLCT